MTKLLDLTLRLICGLKFLTKSVWQWTSTLTLLILTLSRMTLSKVSFSDILGNDYWYHFDTCEENFDFYNFGFYTFKNDTFENV